MPNRTIALLLAAPALFGAVAAGAQTADTAPAGKKKAVVDPNRKVCRTIDTTGSMMGTRACHTKAEWASIDQANSDRVSAGRDMNGGNGSQQGVPGFGR